MEESTSFAIATQQAHKVGKSPKGFRTAEGVRTAKAKMTGPIKEYRKTAMVAAMFDELEKIKEASRIKAFTQAAEREMARAGGRMTPKAQKLHQSAWKVRQDTLRQLKSRPAPKPVGGSARKKKPSLMSRLFGGGSPQPAMAGA
jgi:hypothetical protein